MYFPLHDIFITKTWNQKTKIEKEINYYYYLESLEPAKHQYIIKT